MSIPCTGDIKLKTHVYAEATANGYIGPLGLKDLHAWDNWFPDLPSGPAKLSNFRCREAKGDFFCYLQVTSSTDSRLNGYDFYVGPLTLRYTDGTEDKLYATNHWDINFNAQGYVPYNGGGTMGYASFNKTSLTKTIDWIELNRLSFTTVHGGNDPSCLIVPQKYADIDIFFSDDAGGYTINETTRSIDSIRRTQGAVCSTASGSFYQTLYTYEWTQGTPTQFSGTGSSVDIVGRIDINDLFGSIIP
jgi:hypothetical protein